MRVDREDVQIKNEKRDLEAVKAQFNEHLQQFQSEQLKNKVWEMKKTLDA